MYWLFFSQPLQLAITCNVAIFHSATPERLQAPLQDRLPL